MDFSFLAGNLALDFVATVASRDSVAEEKLRAPADLHDWIAMAGIVDEAPTVTARGLTDALELREAAYTAVRAHAEGGTPSASERAVLNRFAAHPEPVPSIDADGLRRRGDLGAVLSALARAALAALSDPRVRFCDGEDCTRPYIDTSRAHNRRWCGMAGCGDRAKSAAYRARVRTTHTP
ncbi:CGNR zinc finger domain-containing protein [Leifsonia poae]|uniref:Zinc finger CGNR domain-containing protein n=1 Tax=Leifsonia poae TaxID=110933 RepID=A0A9W6HBP7_9MICO|nr:ABATE domain-containing protein [Leifsonia poae]GLJ77601.1 hypothetical protein GCM10017584_31750 [Leifsonia poae]